MVVVSCQSSVAPGKGLEAGGLRLETGRKTALPALAGDRHLSTPLSLFDVTFFVFSTG